MQRRTGLLILLMLSGGALLVAGLTGLWQSAQEADDRAERESLNAARRTVADLRPRLRSDDFRAFLSRRATRPNSGLRQAQVRNGHLVRRRKLDGELEIFVDDIDWRSRELLRSAAALEFRKNDPAAARKLIEKRLAESAVLSFFDRAALWRALAWIEIRRTDDTPSTALDATLAKASAATVALRRPEHLPGAKLELALCELAAGRLSSNSEPSEDFARAYLALRPQDRASFRLRLGAICPDWIPALDEVIERLREEQRWLRALSETAASILQSTKVSVLGTTRGGVRWDPPRGVSSPSAKPTRTGSKLGASASSAARDLLPRTESSPLAASHVTEEDNAEPASADRKAKASSTSNPVSSTEATVPRQASKGEPQDLSFGTLTEFDLSLARDYLSEQVPDLKWSEGSTDSALMILPGLGLRPNFERGAETPWRARLFPALLILIAVVFAAALAAMLIALRRESLAAQTRARFLTSVTHELKTPLASIRLLSEMLEDGRVASEEKRDSYYRLLSGESARLSMLIENVLDLGRMERGERAYLRRPENLHDILRTTVSLFRPLAERDGLAVELNIEPGEDQTLDSAESYVDRGAIAQALLNLLENARKYAAAGERITVRGRSDEEGYRFEVRDFGPGIDPSEREEIFGRFERGQRHRDGSIPGVGLGLHLARTILRDHGGELSVEDPGDPAVGACFVGRLPNRRKT